MTKLLDIYRTLLHALGHRGWWPGDSPLEVMVGAVLTQNTNWQNVEKAIANLKRADMLGACKLANAAPAELEALIRPAGYYRQKAARLGRLARWLNGRGESDEAAIEALRTLSSDRLRQELLAIKGIGPETADSILLYALEKPVFVVDSYTVRILARHGLAEAESSYDEVQALFQDGLPGEVELLKDYHAQLVEVGKRFCRRSRPRCAECPLLELLGRPILEQ